MSAPAPQEISPEHRFRNKGGATSSESQSTTKPVYSERERIEANQRRIIDQSSDAIFLVDCATRRIVQCNAAFCRMLGYTEAEALRLDLYAISAHERSSIDDRVELIALNDSARIGERNYRKKNGDHVQVDVSATVVSLEGGDALAIVARDISERKRADVEQSRLREAVIEAAVEWRETFDSITSAILVVDGNLRVLRLNSAANRMLRAENNQAFRASLSDSASELWQMCKQMVGEALASRQMQQGRTSDAAGGQKEIKVTPAKNDTAIVLIVDVTELHDLQASLRRSETMSAMGSLVAGVAHEVRNPLFCIGATLDAFDARFGFSHEQKEYVIQMRRELERLNGLTRDLLSYGSAQVLDRTASDLSQLVTSAVDLNRALACSKNIQIKVTEGKKIPPIALDVQRMITVLRNMIENALQHAPIGSAVEVSTVVKDAELVCSVRDRGAGFSEQAPACLRTVFHETFRRYGPRSLDRAANRS